VGEKEDYTNMELNPAVKENLTPTDKK